MKKITLVVLLLVVCAGAVYAIATARTGNGYIAWDFGGYDAQSGIFLCPASGHMQAGKWVEDWHNPLQPILPELFTDC